MTVVTDKNRYTSGLKHNWRQFTLLVIVNAFVGGMVGLERTILPSLASESFGIASQSALFSFIVVFGITKALTNYFMGALADSIGRRRLLIYGWLVGLPVPLLLIYAPSWGWVVFANVLLGINQGLTWSSTVVMKIDLAGTKYRGLAMGLNESAGYLAVGAVAFITGYIASEYGVRPYPFYLGVGIAITGLLLSWLLVKDTAHHVLNEAQASTIPKMNHVFADTSWKHPALGAITQAGLINNLNDGMMWGALPVLLAIKGFDLVTIAKIAALYPLVWGVGQLFTGRLADILPKKPILVVGMVLQGIAIILLLNGGTVSYFSMLAVALGLGTAAVYPTFLAAIADYTHPQQRAEAVGVYRLWRDLGYAFGALLTGILADFATVDLAIFIIGFLTVISGVIIQVRMPGK